MTNGELRTNWNAGGIFASVTIPIQPAYLHVCRPFTQSPSNALAGQVLQVKQEEVGIV